MKHIETRFLVKQAQRHDKDAFTELMQRLLYVHA